MVKERKQSFSSYVNNVLQNSMLTGIPQIAAAGNWPKRVVRTLVFCVCVAGFIYQSLTFMWMYWAYEVVVDVQVSNPPYVKKPAYTICIENGFKSTEFCNDPETEVFREKHEILCEDLEYNPYYPDMCICNPRLCDEKGRYRNLTHLYPTSYRLLPTLDQDVLKKYMLQTMDVLKFCISYKMSRDEEWADCEDNSFFINVPCMSENFYPEACLTVDSLVGDPNRPLQTVFTDSEIRLTINNNEDLPPPEELHNPVKMVVHSPYSIENPLDNGAMMLPGKHYTYTLKQVKKKLLPYPYSTNCFDYRKQWEQRGGYGPTNLKECIAECQKNLSMERHGCILYDIHFVGNEKRCYHNISDPSLYFDAMKCSDENCRPACYEEYYTVDVTVLEDLEVRCYMDSYKMRKPTSYARIKLDGMETTSYTYTPKYEDIETFSYLGGYVGMWLGISLVAVFDFIETIFAMMRYPLRRCMRYKERKNRMTQIRKLRHI